MRTKKICNGTLEDYHAICWARLRLLNESDQVLGKCGTNQIKRRIVERNGQYARVDLRTKALNCDMIRLFCFFLCFSLGQSLIGSD